MTCIDMGARLVDQLGSEWRKELGDEFQKPYMQSLWQFLCKERDKGKEI